MTDKLVQSLASDVAGRIKAARELLHRQMEALGLTADKGWRVNEELRHNVEGTEWVFRPIHLREHPPAELELRVQIDQEGRPL